MLFKKKKKCFFDNPNFFLPPTDPSYRGPTLFDVILTTRKDGTRRVIYYFINSFLQYWQKSHILLSLLLLLLLLFGLLWCAAAWGVRVMANDFGVPLTGTVFVLSATAMEAYSMVYTI